MGEELVFCSLLLQKGQRSVGDFLYRRIAGIEALEGGYKSFQIEPLMGGGITWAKGRVITAYGPVSSEWELKNGIFTITVEVPVGTVCYLTMPSGTKRTLGSGKYTMSEGKQK